MWAIVPITICGISQIIFASLHVHEMAQCVDQVSKYSLFDKDGTKSEFYLILKPALDSFEQANIFSIITLTFSALTFVMYACKGCFEGFHVWTESAFSKMIMLLITAPTVVFPSMLAGILHGPKQSISALYDFFYYNEVGNYEEVIENLDPYFTVCNGNTLETYTWLLFGFSLACMVFGHLASFLAVKPKMSKGFAKEDL